VIFIIILLINIIILSKWKLRIPADGSRDYPVAQLLLPGVLMCLVYEYWLLTAFGDLYGTVLIANFMVIFSTTFFYHRFWREQYILNSIGIFGLVALPFIRQEIIIDCILLAIFHIISVVMAFFFRRQFVGSMYVDNLKRSRQELLAAKERAEVSDKLKSVFLSTMSHEVRTPLNVILGYMDILQMSMGKTVTKEQKEFISIINEGSTRLIRLMDDILDITRIEAGKISLQNEVFQGDDIVKLAVTEITVPARKKELEIISNYNCSSVRLHSDIIRLQQVLGNILGNAVKFTQVGTITVTTRVSNKLYNIEIQDTGIGINKEFKPYLFDLFKQAEEGFNRSYEGAGLGLAISYRLISAMKGHIEVESREGHGSTFTITLPIHKLDINKSIASHKKRKNHVKEKIYAMPNDVKPAKKLLVLEDNPANTKYIEFLLKKLGYKYISIDSGTKALAEIESIQPDGMLIDISLSEEMDGIEFLKQVRKIAGFEDTPAIAVTAHAMKGMHEDFLKHGFNDYLSKPFTVKGLAEIIERNL